MASQAGMTDLASQVAALAQTNDGRPRDYDRYPLPAEPHRIHGFV